MEKILIVEDDQAVQKALKRLFESAGYGVEITGNGKSALDVVRIRTPTAIILDLRLPVLSGKDVCVHLKQQLSALPIIILSASTDVQVVLLELGADDYVTKPFSPRELLTRVRAAIRSTRKPIIHDEAEFDGICLDLTKMEVVREGQPIALTAQFASTKAGQPAYLRTSDGLFGTGQSHPAQQVGVTRVGAHPVPPHV